MSDEPALLRAICEHPDEDTPRLAFADYLDETGRPERAEFIRVQCERARGLGDRARRTQLLKRSMRLIQQYGRQWYLRDWPDAGEHAVTGYTFDRGFVDTVSLARRGLGDADVVRVLETRPFVSLVRVWNLAMNPLGDGGLLAIAGCPRLARVRHLILSATSVTLRGIELLAVSPHLASLAEVTLTPAPHAPLTAAELVSGVLAVRNTAREAQAIFHRHGRGVTVRT